MFNWCCSCFFPKADPYFNNRETDSLLSQPPKASQTGRGSEFSSGIHATGTKVHQLISPMASSITISFAHVPSSSQTFPQLHQGFQSKLKSYILRASLLRKNLSIPKNLLAVAQQHNFSTSHQELLLAQLEQIERRFLNEVFLKKPLNLALLVTAAGRNSGHSM